ncbi:unnamed protein product [Ectocarpus sp. CCAP 1310/34]|nr:unnamed protein product [Ectocarpus sp. CCAP 1310/34]
MCWMIWCHADCVVADAVSSGGWVAAAGGPQAPPLPLGGGGGFLQEQARDSGEGPRQLLEGGWASSSGANPVGPAGVCPGIGPDYEEARGVNPPEYQQAKFLWETATALDRAEIVRIVSTVHASLPEGRTASKATALDRAEIVRIVSTVHASLPEGRTASKGQRRAEHALLASDRSGGGRGNGGRRMGGGGGGGGNQKGIGGGAKAGGSSGGGDDDAGSMRGRCFRCGKKSHQVANCPESKPVRCEICKGYGHDKSKCPTEEAVLVVEVPAEGASADTTALDVAEDAMVVGNISVACHKVVGRGGVE